MPKKKNKETASQQSARFCEEAQKLIDAGELSPTEADAAVGRIVKNSKTKKDDSLSDK